MKKIILLLAIAGLTYFNVNGQNGRCVSTQYMKEEMQRNPQYAIDRENLERFTEQYIQQNPDARRGTRALPYVIPLVFHILHDNGPENVADSVIVNAVRIMNEDFRKLNADTAQIVPSFIPIAADCEIEFRLATKDPNGGCTNGILHKQTLLTYNANNASKQNPWPNNKYLNIWVAYSLERQGAAAWAYLPGAPNNVDGIMCWYTYVDNISRAVTHEVGHCLNLKHPWGDEDSPEVTCGDDGVNDTPITKGWSPGNCNLSGSICSPPIIENVQNHMDYSYCSNMFTAGQKARMHATLNNIVNGRNNLWTNTNLIATGTDTPTGSTCIPIADFSSDYAYACAGDSVHYSDISYNAVPTSWNWTFPGGSPSTSTLQHPNVVYVNAGSYSATLKSTSSAGTDSITKTSFIRVTASPLHTVPFVESFEDTSSFPGNDGFLINPDGNSTWTRVTNTASTGSACIKMNNYTNIDGEIDEWVTPSLDFSNMNFPITIQFKVSHAQRNSTSNDKLKLFYSLNCGRSWSSGNYSKQGAGLATAGIVSSNFTPNNPSQWRQESVTVNAVQNKPNVRFKFQSTSNHGNNVYIDDINFSGLNNAVGDLDELESDFSLYPNPSKGITKMEFSLTKTSEVKIEIKDIIGQTVFVVMNGTISAGAHENSLPVLSPGIYLVDFIVNNKHHIRKLVVS